MSSLYYYIHFSDKFSVSLGNVTCRELPLGAGPALQLPPTSSTSKKLSESCPCEESEVSDIRRVLSDVLSIWVRPTPGTPGSRFLPPPRPFSLSSGVYRRVCDVLLISFSSRERKEREWPDTAEDVLLLSEQCGPERSRRDPPMRQKRHLNPGPVTPSSLRPTHRCVRAVRSRPGCMGSRAAVCVLRSARVWAVGRRAGVIFSTVLGSDLGARVWRVCKP